MRIIRAILPLLIIASASLAACSGTTKIGDVLANTSKYEGKEIVIKGTVGDSAWLPGVGKGTYQLGDGSGNMWVITSQPPPQKGQSISSKGKVQSAFSILGQSYGTVLIEASRS